MKTAQESVKTGHVYLNIYSDQADGEIGIIASMFKEMADAFSQIEGLIRVSHANLACNPNSETLTLKTWP